MSKVKKIFLQSIVVLFANLSVSNSFTCRGQEMQGGLVPGTCDEVMVELAKFKDVWTEWGTTKEGDPWRSTRRISAGGEWFADGVTFYKSKSRFNKSVRQITEDKQSLAGPTPILDEKGRRIGQRVVKETWEDGKATGVTIWLITKRMIQGINAPSLKLALTVEKAYITCRAEADRR